MPFQVSSNGQSVQTANGPSVLLNDTMPLTKLDVTNTVSFQTIRLLFNHEPPQPTTSNFTVDTLLYQFKHGYAYIPAVWFGWQNPSPAYPAPPASGATATTFKAFGDDSASADISTIGNASALSLFAVVAYNDPVNGVGNYSMAILYVIVDKTYVNLYIRKAAYRETSSSTVIPVYVIGETVNIRICVFTEPATTSIY